MWPLIIMDLLLNELGDNGIIRGFINAGRRNRFNGRYVKAKELLSMFEDLTEKAISELERSNALHTPSTSKEMNAANLLDVINRKFKQEVYNIQKESNKLKTEIEDLKVMSDNNQKIKFEGTHKTTLPEYVIKDKQKEIEKQKDKFDSVTKAYRDAGDNVVRDHVAKVNLGDKTNNGKI